ncbi:YitT family protein [Enterococcus hulanensis]|uniref:YitT family protein n=1 Tax=Enterococcus hulanensis TaxID=2559929 RepID=A0ABU3F3L4_9ENTE|nr:YitT family protein [Enterococcus hulanensis]MDT2601715.1 YitT family protein [Enterococcus hulanensis]MDT2611100.1 YitT family protein [Enterococcus hulanensis]MDT2618614.1 YitT family protein [Enterococcus hulanensis]MDT2629759.1 YitT family protein [Enterococcus hulanensis]MDT2657491.1 YitT family protein [Enterococcus hulanensis]
MHLIKISIGVIIIALALNFFLLPHDIASAGVGAIGHLLEIHLSVNSIYTLWVINLFMLLLTYLLLDKQIFSKIFLGSLLFPIYLKLIPTSPVLFSHIASLIIGSALFSLGVFYLYKSNSSNGGITIPPIILERYFKIPVYRGLLLTNLVIIFLNFYILRPLDGLFATVSILIMSVAMKLYTAIDSKLMEREGKSIGESNHKSS